MYEGIYTVQNRVSSAPLGYREGGCRRLATAPLWGWERSAAAAAAGEQENDQDDPDPAVVVEDIAKAVVHNEPP